MSKREGIDFVAKILALVGDAEPARLAEARAFVDSVFTGQVRQTLQRIITICEDLATGTELRSDSPLKPGPDVGSASAHWERELLAILNDTAFAPLRSDVVLLIERVFPPNTVPRFDSKDSRTAIVSKALRAFETLSEDEKTTLYRTLRKFYLRGRRSSLGDWSDNIERDSDK